MSDETIVELLDRAAERVPASEPPLTDLLRSGRRNLRRRRTAVLSGVVATIVAVAGVGAIARTMQGGDHATPPATAGPPAPPAGMKWVGIGRTVVAVPRSWSMWPGLYCPSRDRHDHITIVQPTVGPACPPIDPTLPHEAIVTLSEQDGTLAVNVDYARSDSGVSQDQIEATRKTLPSGWLAVPAAASLTGTGTSSAEDEARALEAAGFSVIRAQELHWKGPTVRTEPAIGAPARVGSTVTVFEGMTSPAVASLSGRLLWVGGPAPGSPTPHAGTVHVVGDGLDWYISAGRDGRWSFEGPAGTFTVTASSPGYLSAAGVPRSCRAGHRVTLRWEKTTKVKVYCQLK